MELYQKSPASWPNKYAQADQDPVVTTTATLAVAYNFVQVVYKTHATPSSCSTSSQV